MLDLTYIFLLHLVEDIQFYLMTFSILQGLYYCWRYDDYDGDMLIRLQYANEDLIKLGENRSRVKYVIDHRGHWPLVHKRITCVMSKTVITERKGCVLLLQVNCTSSSIKVIGNNGLPGMLMCISVWGGNTQGWYSLLN